MMFMRTLLYKGGRLVSHFLPVDDIDPLRRVCYSASAEVKDCLVKVAKVHGVVNTRRCVEGTVEV